MKKKQKKPGGKVPTARCNPDPTPIETGNRPRFEQLLDDAVLGVKKKRKK